MSGRLCHGCGKWKENCDCDSRERWHLFQGYDINANHVEALLYDRGFEAADDGAVAAIAIDATEECLDVIDRGVEALIESGKVRAL